MQNNDAAETRQTRPRGPRYGFIDAIRGIAACIVMLQHSFYESGLLPGSALGKVIPSLLELGETGVVAFFLVSGFVIPLSLEKTDDLRLFWLHRSLRIYPLYLTVYAVTLLISGWGLFAGAPQFLASFAAHLFFVQEYLQIANFVGGSWTLSLEAVWYLGVSVLFCLSLNRKTWFVVTIAVVFSLAAEIACALGHHLPMGRLSMLVCCVAGMVCYRRESGALSPEYFRVVMAILLAVITANLLVGMLLFPSPHPTASFQMAGDSWLLAALIFFIPFTLRESRIWGHSFFSFLGRISYSIYLVHPIILLILTRLKIVGPVAVLLTAGATILIATATYRWIEAPAIRFGHSRKASRTVVAG
jgi:peptidoglycan/LPS O-acetylase OafA/YrhL